MYFYKDKSIVFDFMKFNKISNTLETYICNNCLKLYPFLQEKIIEDITPQFEFCNIENCCNNAIYKISFTLEEIL